MTRRVEEVFILRFLVGNGECRVSHLQFADDTMIFYDADMNYLGYSRCILRCFETVSGLNINFSKNELFQVEEVSNIETLPWILGWKIGMLP